MSTPRFGLLALLFALLIVYASTVVGPLGFHFVPIDPWEALDRLFAIDFAKTGSDQRSDWMGNVAMLVPLGFLVAGWIARGNRLSILAALIGFVLCLGFVVAVKYVQLFFPPRTVTLNYVLAQTLGVTVGICLYAAFRPVLSELGQGAARLETLRLLLIVYAVLAVLFALAPLDFALNEEDLAAQLSKMPDTLLSFAGEGRPVPVRLAMIVAGSLAMAPIGALLTIEVHGRAYVGRSVALAAGLGFCAMMALYAASLLVLSGAPSLPSVLTRTLGIALGAWVMHWLVRQDPDGLRDSLSALVPWCVPLYLAGLLVVNGLISRHWIEPAEALAAIGPRTWIPLYNYYIVSKAQAALNIAAHAVMYVPAGVMIWLRIERGSGAVRAFLLAALLSLLIETGRFLRPGLVPDINAVPLAGIAACAAALMMPWIWRLLGTVAIGGGAMRLGFGPDARAAVPGWRDRAATRRRRRRTIGKPIGDVEDY